MTQILELNTFLLRALERRSRMQARVRNPLRSPALAFDLVSRCNAKLLIGKSTHPFYDTVHDHICMPAGSLRMLRRPALLATEILHELVHWSGASARLNRPAHEKRFDAVYNREELVAEIGAVLLSYDLGITERPILPNHTYLALYLSTLDRPDIALQVALSSAQQAASYLHVLQNRTS